MHVLIVGSVQVGKSTLIRKLLKELKRPVCGFETRKEGTLIHEDGGVPIYIYKAGGPYEQTKENLIGISRGGKLEIFKDAFDRFAARLAEEIDVAGAEIILMDEIGHMETQSEAFCDVITKALDGDRLVIAAVKHKQKPFLEKVRNHPNARCFYVTEENRDSIGQEIVEFIQSQGLYPES